MPNTTYTKNMSKNLRVLDVPTKFHTSTITKISNKSKNAFSLPAGPKYSCPGATDACKDCYAMKGRHYFSNVQQAFGGNWKLLSRLKRNRASKKVIRLLQDAVPKHAKVFRIHESGDWYSQEYVDAWTAVIRSRPDVKFWAYTRSFHLNFQKIVRLKNFALWASTDSYNKVEATDFVKRYKRSNVKHAYGPWEHDRELPEGSFPCPVTTNQLALDGACEKCMLCVDKHRVKKNVVFLAH